MQIDPRTAIWLNIIYAIVTGVSAPSLQAAGVAHAEQFVAIMALVALPLNVIIHAFSSSAPGPLAPPDAGTPPSPPKVNAHYGATLAALALALALGGCLTTAQVQSYTAAVQATGVLLKQIGRDVVVFDCQNAALIEVIAKDVNAAARVQATLAKNAQLAADVCPAIAGTAAVKVVAGS